MRKRQQHAGFTLIELLIVVAIIGIIAAIAVPGLMRAKQSGNEASAIGSVRAVVSAETAFAASCGGGGYATSLPQLGTPPQNGVAFISPDLAGGNTVVKSGYNVTVEDGTNAQDVLAQANTCNAVGPSRSTFFVHAEPVATGSSGQRAFASNESGTIYQNNNGAAIANTMANANILQ